MTDNEWTEIEERFERLSFEGKLRLLERLIRQLRRNSVDAAAFEQGVRDMAADPAVQRDCQGLRETFGRAGGSLPNG